MTRHGELHVDDALTGLPVRPHRARSSTSDRAAARPGSARGSPSGARLRPPRARAQEVRLPRVRGPVVPERPCRLCPGRGPRAEDGRDAYAVALARALAPQAVAAEWCLPLVRPGGRWSCTPASRRPASSAVAEALAAGRRPGPSRARRRKAGACSSSRSSARLPSGFPAARVLPGSVPSRESSSGLARLLNRPMPSVTRPHGTGGLRCRQPEGRRRQDDHHGQPGGLPRRGGRARARRRSGPSGECHLGVGRARAPAASSYDLLDGAPARRGCARDPLRESPPCAVQADARRRGGRACPAEQRRDLPRPLAGGGARSATRSSSSTARRRSAR